MKRQLNQEISKLCGNISYHNPPIRDLFSESNLAVIRSITMPLGILLENRIEILGNFKYMQLKLFTVPLFQSIWIQCMDKFSYHKCLPGFRFRGMPLSYNSFKVKQH